MEQQAVEGGDYASTSEVVRKVLDEWKTRRQLMLNGLSALKADIDQGLDWATEGRVKFIDADHLITQGELLAERSN